MTYKDLSFSSYFIIVEDSPLDVTEFKKVFAVDEEFEVNSNDINNTVTISEVDNFAQIFIEYGNPFPRPDNVRNTDTKLSELNPRKPNQYEPKQEFGLIDFERSTLWISNSKRKSFFIDLFKKRFKTLNIIIKNVYSEEEFLSSIKRIEEIKFSAEPNLFSIPDSLSQELADEILGYGATVATLTMKFHSQSMSEKILLKIQNLMSTRHSFKSLVIVGRDEDDFGIIFNNDILMKKISLKVIINENEIYDKDNVFSQLITALKNA